MAELSNTELDRQIDRNIGKTKADQQLKVASNAQ
jgi:hypothetical protein